MALSKSSSPTDRRRFSKLALIIVEELTPILRDVLANEISPSVIFHQVKSNVNLFKKLRHDQILIIKNAHINGYRDFDITLLYTLIRTLCPNIPSPTRGWGISEMPSPGETSLGDDIEREPSGSKVGVDDLPSGSKESPPVPTDTLLLPPKQTRKTESDRELHEEESYSRWSDTTFNKKLEQLKENGEFECRIQRLISSLDIETFYHQSDREDQTEFVDVIQRVDYLDCSGLHLSDAEKQSKSFKPFSRSSVDAFLGWMADCDEVFRKTRAAKCRLVLSILFSAYTKETLLKFKQRDLLIIIHRCLDYAIEKQNHILILELVRSNPFDFDFHFDKLLKNKEINSVVMDTFLTTAKYRIIRECPRLRQNAMRLSFCFECSQENRLVIMMLYKGSIEMKDGIPEKAMGVKLAFYNYIQPSDEASIVFNSFPASCSSGDLPVITENDARKLFKKHSNLTLISTSPYKSSGYSKGKYIIVEKRYISLLCLHKGFIPFGEVEFPKQINGFDVDVQEGHCSLGSGRSIDFGGHIRRAKGINTPGHGSIGGFVDLSNGSTGLITCAHVVFSTDELFKPNSEIEDYVLCRDTDLKVEFFDKNQHNFQVCGNIVKKCFPTSIYDISVDATLIELDQSLNEFGFPVALADQLYLAGFEPNKPPVFKGEVVSLQDPETDKIRSSDDLQKSRIPGRLNSVIKYGSETRFTIGNFYFDRVHIRFANQTLDLPDQNGFATMYNQIEIQSLPHGTFFKPGDSGAFVFCINPDKTLSCLGMAIGSSTKGSCLVTPMVRILDSFELPHRLKPCSPFVSGDNARVSEDPTSSQLADQSHDPSAFNLEAILLNFQKNIQKSMADMKNALQTRNRKFENGSSRNE
ncbi:uncharacterized protein LOC133201923 [Saccostrea echinata]|uniref:uncharacterized protein LOC133201923 n=1 Tax=Saccostrea echinata TaxID=191078 RepID=UPI002A83BAC0|nr:uncharacterized protein LOC133201923 [Saccostrea echinata]